MVQLKVLEEFAEGLGRNIKTAKEKGKEKKLERLKKKMIDFIIDLKQDGVIVEYDKKDGKGEVTKEGLEKMEIEYLHKNYVEDTIKGITKEVERREKEAEKDKKEWNKKYGIKD